MRILSRWPGCPREQMRTVGNNPAPCSQFAHSPRTPALASSADWFCQAQNAEKQRNDIYNELLSPNEYAARGAVFKSNYAANQKQYHISYINTFKDIFLIILFFSDNILRRNLINTLRETWVQHANVQRARGSSIRPAAAAAPCQHHPVTRPPGKRLPGPFAVGG